MKPSILSHICIFFALHAIAIEHGIAQITFERELGVRDATCAIRDSDGSYFMLTAVTVGNGSNFGVTRLASSGEQKNIRIRDPQNTIYYNDFHDLQRTSSGIAAIGREHGTDLVLFTCTADLENRAIHVLAQGSVSMTGFDYLADQGYVVAAVFEDPANDYNIRVMRLDANANGVWEIEVDKPTTLRLVGIYELANGDLLLVADENGDGLILRISADGNSVVWEKYLTGSDGLAILAARFQNDHLYLLGSTAEGTTGELVQIDGNGDIVARNILFTKSSAIFFETTFTLSDDGRLAVITDAWPDKGFNLMLFDADFVLKKTVMFERATTYDGYTRAKSIVDAPDGFFITASAPDALAIKTDNDGSSGDPPPFQEVEDPGLLPEYGHNYYAWIDLENDGKKELVVANGSVRMFSHDDATGKFREIAVPFGEDLSNTYSVSICDFNNDGAMDLYANRYMPGGNGGYFPVPNLLLKNNGDGTFSSVGDLNINDAEMSTLQSVWFDINNDGFQDLFTVNVERDKAYLNRGDGTFDEVAPENFEEKNDWIYPAHYTFRDVNSDGFVDYIAAQNLQIDVMLNIQGQRFEKHALLEFFDYSLSALPAFLYEVTPGYFNGRKCAMLMDGRGSYFEQDGDIYRQTSLPSGLVNRNNPTKGEFIDFENDGDLDIYLNGENIYDIRTHLFQRNDSETGFTRYRRFSNERFRNFTFYDADGNGAPDIVGGDGVVKFLKNTSANNWLTVTLEGNISTRVGDGAVVSVKANGKWAHQELTTHAGHNGKVEYEAHFGLNKALVADSIRIEWPSGCVTVQTNVSANQFVSIEEDCSGPAPEMSYTSKVCQGEAVTVSVNSTGTKFSWFTDLTSPAIAVSGTQVEIDTLTRSVTFFVANADSTRLSRRVPVRIEVVPLPEFSIVTEQNGNTVQLSIETGPVPDSFTWTVNEQVVSNDVSFDYPFDTSGLLTVCGEAVLEGCVFATCMETVVTSVDETQWDSDIYPNPFQQTFVIREMTTLPIEVFTAQGRRIPVSHSKDEHAIEVDLTGYPPGVYFVKVNAWKFVRVIKAR